MAFVQRRKGPDVVGSFGLLQPLADGLKLILKEPISPSSANFSLFRMAPVATFMLSLVARAVVPFDYGMVLSDPNMGGLYLFAISSLGVYGIIIAGWSSNGPCTSLSPGGWPPILDLPIFKKIPGSIWFSIKVILFLFLYIWVRAAFPRYRYDQLMGLGRKVFLPLSLARVVPVSGVLVTFQWLPVFNKARARRSRFLVSLKSNIFKLVKTHPLFQSEHKAHNNNKTNRDFIRDHLSCRS
ncbi:NADH dehydrogenase subunit 1 (mitochondrion) [Quercus suber]|uniref:NADH-ubiquinone oxidoreductase chain 1 n=1 Tax=Quercus suber TaxID=58331 RepID=A0AAW0I4H5_QUESU